MYSCNFMLLFFKSVPCILNEMRLQRKLYVILYLKTACQYGIYVCMYKCRR